MDSNRKISPTEERLLDVLKHGPMVRDTIVEMTDIPRTTAYDWLRKLIIKRKVIKYPDYEHKEEGLGRPKVLFELAEQETKVEV